MSEQEDKDISLFLYEEARDEMINNPSQESIKNYNQCLNNLLIYIKNFYGFLDTETNTIIKKCEE